MSAETLAEAYFPLTANQGAGYREIEACPALKPWIRCFWVYTDQCDQIVIPDTCMDIILCVDETGKSEIFFLRDQRFHIYLVQRQRPARRAIDRHPVLFLGGRQLLHRFVKGRAEYEGSDGFLFSRLGGRVEAGV